MSLRFPSAACYADQVTKEQRWLPELAPQLPLPIPVPLAMGEPGFGYPWCWSVYRWLDGETARRERIPDLPAFAIGLAGFLEALRRCDTAGAPVPGAHNFHRGGALRVYDEETHSAIEALGDRIDAGRAAALWDRALDSRFEGTPVWLHGDVAEGNLLQRRGRLTAVIDFGCCAVGDPACDLTIAWTLFAGQSRSAFHDAVGLDEETWARARGWALWKALITIVAEEDAHGETALAAMDVVAAVLAETRA